jgi:anhydro-N-acetylmuramic acid kinase
MNLLSPLKKKRLMVLGLNSGTSADGLDLALLKIDRAGGAIRIAQVAGARRRYPRNLRQAVLSLADAPTVSPDDLIYIDQALGQFYGRTAAAFIKRWEREGTPVDIVASHGQTVRHLPKKTRFVGFTVNGTLQLGSPEQIAARTGRVVVADFRQGEVALGHEGAPITTAAMQRLFASTRESRLIVNIGGMSNFFFFPGRRSPLETMAADCGPGNSLCDLLCERLFGVPFDRGGRLALAGQASKRLLTLLLAEPFFQSREASTGREVFGRGLAERIIERADKLRLSKHDIIATAAELTVTSIANGLRPILRRDSTVRNLYLTGGGVHNRFFARRLSEQLDGLEVVSIQQLGFDPGLVEASAYAVMGEAALRSESASVHRAGGAGGSRRAILGRIVQPPQEIA